MIMALRKWLGTPVLYQKHRLVGKFLQQVRRARQVQRERLLAKLRASAESDFGREHHFHEICTPAQFRRRVPLSGYEQLRPYIDRLRRGRTDALLRPGTPVLMFALTSGTTAAVKYIPITPQFVAEYRRSWNIWGAQAFWDHPAARYGYMLQLASDWDQTRTEAGTPCGNISGLIACMQHPLLRMGYCVPAQTAKIRDPDAKHYVTLRAACARRFVTMATTANPSTLVALAQCADRWKEMLVRDIADGTLSWDGDVPHGVREALRAQFRAPRRRRAEELARIIEQTGHLYPRDFWPHMRLLAVWTGGSVGLYLPLLRRYYGDVPVRDHGLSASEGRMTIPFQDGRPAGVLDIGSHYFEFIPEEERYSARPTVLE
ncbi:MAG: GH3 family domain-containing protein, partial [Pirellulales bacterium]